MSGNKSGRTSFARIRFGYFPYFASDWCNYTMDAKIIQSEIKVNYSNNWHKNASLRDCIITSIVTYQQLLESVQKMKDQISWI